MSRPDTNDYMAAEWRPVFAHHGLQSFEDFWQRELQLVDKPNVGRGGWSVVARCEFAKPDGGSAAVFLKRQENHNLRTWRHPVRGVPTLEREFENIRRCQECGVPTLVPLYFARRRVEGKWRAILITEELSGFQPVGMLARQWRAEQAPGALRFRAVRAVAALMRGMHEQGLRHNNFYPKHVFMRLQGDKLEARIIDLEKSTWHGSARACRLNDLRTLHRRAPGWSRTDRLRFLLEYLGHKEVTAATRKMWRQISRV